MLLHQLEEQVQYEGCALLYGLCAHPKQNREKRQGANGSNDNSDNEQSAATSSADEEAAVNVFGRKCTRGYDYNR